MEIENDLLQQVISEYITTYCVEDGQRSKTIRIKERLLQRLIVFLNGRPFNLETVREFQQVLHNDGWKKDSSKDCLARILRAFVNYCYEEKDLFIKNWAKKIKKQKLPRQVIEVVKESVAMQIIIAGCTPGKLENSFSRASKKETQLALEFMLLSACRVNEVYEMKGSDLRLEADDPYVMIHSKGGKKEMQPVPQTMIPILQERLGNDRLFRFDAKTANKLLARGSVKLGITAVKTTCHRLRDIFAITRLRNGDSLQVVSRALRHDSVKTTDRYYSNYMLSDIAPVVNNSDLVRQTMTPDELLAELLKLVRKAGLYQHKEFDLRTTTSEQGVHIDAVFKHVE